MKFFILFSIFLTLSCATRARHSHSPYSLKSAQDCKEPGTVTLTLDDGPEKELLVPILDILDKENVKASLFVIGKKLEDENARKLIKKAHEDGHLILNHTYEHFGIRDKSEEFVKEQILLAEAAIENAIEEPPLKLVRPTYGAWDEITKKAVEDLGYEMVLWSYHEIDWSEGSSPESIIEGYRKNLPESKGGDSFIILQHDNEKKLLESLEEIIHIIKSRGFKFVRLDECLGL